MPLVFWLIAISTVNPLNIFRRKCLVAGLPVVGLLNHSLPLHLLAEYLLPLGGA